MGCHHTVPPGEEITKDCRILSMHSTPRQLRAGPVREVAPSLSSSYQFLEGEYVWISSKNLSGWCRG